MFPRASAIVDLQFGSTGKGNLAAYLGMTGAFDAAVTNWGPNAGHTAVYPDGTKIVRTMLANSVHRGGVRTVFIGPGSAINIDALIAESIQTFKERQDFKIYIHEHASIVTDEHREREAAFNRIGSTQKGTAMAYIEKMMRNKDTTCLAKHFKDRIEQAGDYFPAHVVSHEYYMGKLMQQKSVLMEGCQGYSLGINSGFWPYTTSRECTVAQLAADTLIPPRAIARVYGVMRTFPIRVANRNGATEIGQDGYSGPCYDDQVETTWEAIGRPVEHTTVTKLPRRVFTFSNTQVEQAIMANGCTDLFVNFVNYLPTVKLQRQFVESIEKLAKPHNCIVSLTGHGPNTDDIVLNC